MFIELTHTNVSQPTQKRVNANVEAQVWKGKWQLVSINTATLPARGNEHEIEYTQISVTWEKA